MQVQQPKQVEPEGFGRRVAAALTGFIHRFRFVLWGVLGAAIVFLVGYFGWSEITAAAVGDGHAAGRAGRDDLRLLARGDGHGEKGRAREGPPRSARRPRETPRPAVRHPACADAARRPPASSSAAWDEAAADYRELARRFPASYLAPIALFNAATCLEEKSDREGAVKLYTDIVTRWKETAVAPRALFALGRLAEDAGTWDEAKSRYEQLDAEWPTSSWTQLAKNRLGCAEGGREDTITASPPRGGGPRGW